MAHYVSIRGWLECEPEVVEEVRRAQQAAHHTAVALSPDRLDRYADAWCYPKVTSNWTAYIFFGANIHDAFVGWFRSQLEAMVHVVPDLDGLFHLDGDHYRHAWRVHGGSIAEEPRSCSESHDG